MRKFKTLQDELRSLLIRISGPDLHKNNREVLNTYGWPEDFLKRYHGKDYKKFESRAWLVSYSRSGYKDLNKYPNTLIYTKSYYYHPTLFAPPANWVIGFLDENYEYIECAFKDCEKEGMICAYLYGEVLWSFNIDYAMRRFTQELFGNGYAEADLYIKRMRLLLC